jgi:hypothetical protein
VSGQFVVVLGDLPEAPLDAAAHFYSEHMPLARKMLNNEWSQIPGLPEEAVPRMAETDIEALAFIFPAAGKDHQGWRLAAIQALAREVAPKRVNGIAGDDLDAIDTTIDWLAEADGITGQLLAVEAG